MQTKYTPGPWEYVPDPTGKTGGHIAGPNGESVTTIKNAQLIAAAPDLLAALETVVGLAGFESDEPYGKAVLAAIAKAKGEK